jgi:hypothetical protein
MSGEVSSLPSLREIDRYAWREIDVHELLTQPEVPLPWRAHGVAVDGRHTIIAGPGGIHKTWLVTAIGDACSTGGGNVGEIECTAGPWVHFDAEMGPAEFKRRYHVSGYGGVCHYYDATGINLQDADDQAWITAQITKHVDPDVGGLVTFDSLRRLTPKASENDSDAMAPVTAFLTELSRGTRAAVVTIHHMGWDARHSRGSSGIFDQCDAMMHWKRLPVTEDPDQNMRVLTGKGEGQKFRMGAEPDPRYFLWVPETCRIETDQDFTPAKTSGDYATAILQNMPTPSKAECVRTCGTGRNNSAFEKAWDTHLRATRIEKDPDTGPNAWRLTDSGRASLTEPNNDPSI